MSSENFTLWLQGFFELSNQEGQTLDAQQVQIIKDHLKLVFEKKTPIYQPKSSQPYVDEVPTYTPNTPWVVPKPTPPYKWDWNATGQDPNVVVPTVTCDVPSPAGIATDLHWFQTGPNSGYGDFDGKSPPLTC